jgi:p-methyltransferase
MSWASSPRLNGIYLYSFLQSKHYNVALINRYDKEKEYFNYLLEHQPRCIIVSTTFILNKSVLNLIVNDIRKLAPDSLIVVGGPFVYMSYLILQKKKTHPFYDVEPAKKDYLFLDNNNIPDADLFVIHSRGEHILPEILNRRSSNTSFTDLPNTAVCQDNKWHINPIINDHDKWEKHVIQWDKLPEIFFRSGVMPLQASTGCVNQCKFCNFVKSRRHIRIKPLDTLITEIKQLEKRGIKYVWFVDDNFRLGKTNLEYVCKRFIDEKISVKWMSFIRADVIQHVDPQLLIKSGCIEVQLGVETANASLLQKMNKKMPVETYEKVIPALLREGINCSCYFIFGFPGETQQTIEETIRFINNINPLDAKGILTWSIFPFILSPLSPVYEPEFREKHSLNGYLREWQHETMNSEEALQFVVQAFISIQNSGPIYRNDNLFILNNFSSEQKKNLYQTRNQLCKELLRKKIDVSLLNNKLKQLVEERLMLPN